MWQRVCSAALSCVLLSFLAAHPAHAVDNLPNASPPAVDRPNTPPSMFLEYIEPGVVVLALGAVDPNEELSRAMWRSMLGEEFAEHSLLDVQMSIAHAAAAFDRVLLLAANSQTSSLISERCENYHLCDLLASGKVRIAIVSHQGPWIRDYGPQIGTSKDDVVVLDAQYSEPRRESSRKKRQAVINLMRLYLIHLRDQHSGESIDEEPLSEFSDTDMDLPAELFEELPPGFFLNVPHEPVVIDQKLASLREMADIYRDGDFLARQTDDESPFELAQAAFKQSFSLYRPKISLDGGEFIPFEGGDCITSRELIAKNGGVERSIRRDLLDFYGCQQIIYLHPLPGPNVIQHIDMFLLPAGGKRVFLAWYDPTEEPLKTQWGNLFAQQKNLILEAAVAMYKNEEELKRQGYEVIRVPSLAPRIEQGSIFYPTVLNALVQVAGDGRRQVLMPFYEDYEEDIQQRALEVLKAGFGPDVKIEQIESTVAAQNQGAIHCLTIVIPRRLSIFEDQNDTLIRERLAALVRDIESEEVSTRDYDFEGTWARGDGIEEAEKHPEASTLVVRDGMIAVLQGEEKNVSWPYRIIEKKSKDWFLTVSPDDLTTGEQRGQILWDDGDHIRLVLDDAEISLQRIFPGNQDPQEAAPTEQRPRG
ncbi:MAG: agmatine deiminase family protein [Thermoanaerobaculia bacterium]